MSSLNKILQTSVLSLVLLISSGCSTISSPKTNCITDITENSPISEVELQTQRIIADPKIKEFYKHYFPNGKFELSYEKKTKSYETRTFVEPQISKNKDSETGLNYGFFIGLDTRF